MSTVELTEANGAWWSPLLAVVLLVAFCFAVWAVLHAPLIWRRGHAYRTRIRAARHARPSLVRSTR